MSAMLLTGTWKLVSYELHGSDGSLQRPLGEHPVGRLVYDADGHMIGQCVNPDRVKFAHANPSRGSADEIRAAFTGCIAYFGTWTVDETRGTVTHRVQGSLFPNWAGTDQVRHFKLAGRRLTLSTPPIATGAREIIGVLVWEREA